MASEPQIDYSDLAKAGRDIYREYGGPGIMLKMADEIERLREALYHADEGLNYLHLYDESKYRLTDG